MLNLHQLCLVCVFVIKATTCTIMPQLFATFVIFGCNFLQLLPFFGAPFAIFNHNFPRGQNNFTCPEIDERLISSRRVTFCHYTGSIFTGRVHVEILCGCVEESRVKVWVNVQGARAKSWILLTFLSRQKDGIGLTPLASLRSFNVVVADEKKKAKTEITSII